MARCPSGMGGCTLRGGAYWLVEDRVKVRPSKAESSYDLILTFPPRFPSKVRPCSLFQLSSLGGPWLLQVNKSLGCTHPWHARPVAALNYMPHRDI